MTEWLTSQIDIATDVLTLARPFAPYSTAAIAAIAGVIAWFSYRHRRIAHNRAEWWRRAQYAIDLVCTEDDKVGRNTGMRLLTHLLKDPSSTQSDAELLEDTVDSLIDEVVSRAGRGDRPERRSPRLPRWHPRRLVRTRCEPRRSP